MFNQKGAGIVLVLIVCSLVGAAALYLMDMTKVSEQKIALDAKVQSYQSLVKIVTNQLHSGNTCSNVLAGTVLTPDAFSTKGISIQLDLKLPMNSKILKAPPPYVPPAVPRDVWFLSGGTSIKDVQLFINERVRTPVHKAAAGSPTWVAAKGYVLIIPAHPGVGVKLTRGRQYRIPIFLYYSDAGGGNKRLESCSDPTGDAYFCTLMGGTYDFTETIEDRKCQPDRSCFPYKAGLVTSPGSCPAPYVASSIGFTGSDLYLCDWCNQNPILPEPTPLNGSYYIPSPPSPYEVQMGVPAETYLPLVAP